ncbi:hypothetical protein QWJ90_08695 [Microbacterium oryzae]|nr:hypothetical protein [Microbacterium oryzae]MDN3311008.1 hypothetical protein [Microbacterium oryzae]
MSDQDHSDSLPQPRHTDENAAELLPDLEADEAGEQPSPDDFGDAANGHA